MIRLFLYGFLFSALVVGCADEGEVSLKEQSQLKYFLPGQKFNGVSAYVRTIVEDKDGVIWLGTDQGISKITNGKVQVVIDDLLVFTYASMRDSDDNIWFGTIDGPLVWNGTDFNRLQLFIDNPWIPVTSIAQADDGRMWLGTKCCGVLVMDETLPDGFIQYYDENCSDCNLVNSVFEDESGDMWVGSEADLKKISGSTITTYTSADGVPDFTSILTIYQDSWGKLWFGTHLNGFYYLKDNHFERYPGPSSMNNTVNDIIDSTDGGLYMATLTNGVWYHNGITFDKILVAPPDDDDVSYEFINGVYIDGSDRLWIASDKGAILKSK